MGKGRPAAYWVLDGVPPNGYWTAGGLMGEEVGGESSCEAVGLHIVLVGGFSDEGGLGHGLLDDMRHLEESASSFAESEVDHFVSRIQNAWDVTTLLHRLVSQTEVRETLQVGLFEGEVMRCEEVESWYIALPAFGIGERILDRQSHVGCTELCLDTTIDELHGGVYDRLRMDEHLDAIDRQVEEPTCLDDLEALVHHAGGVDGDLSTHLPVGVLERLCGSDMLHLFERESAERSAAGCEQEFLDGVGVLAHERLEDS